MIVVKIGGASGVNLDSVCADISDLVNHGQQVTIVHGGSAETNDISTQLGHPPLFLTAVSGFTSRYTDRETLEIFAMVTSGKINTLLVERLQKNGVNAFGLSGVDGRLLVAKRKDSVRILENGKQRIIRDDFTGKVEQVNVSVLQMLIKAGFTPVVAPLAISYEGDALNIDADRAAAVVAGALKADAVIFLTNVPGLLRNYPDESSLIPHIDRSKVEETISYAEGRMKKKVLGACEALKLGVNRIVFADGRIEQPLMNALNGKGTVIS